MSRRQPSARNLKPTFQPNLEPLERRTLMAAGPVLGPRGVQILGDFSGVEGSPLAFQGTFEGSANAASARFLWRAVDSVGRIVSQGDRRDFSFVPRDEGAYSLSFVVTVDGTSTQTVSLLIANAPPTIRGIVAAKSDLDRQITFSATIADPGPDDGPTTHWQIIEHRTGLVIKQSEEATYSLKLRHRGDYTAFLTVTDDDGATTTASTTFTIGNVSLPTFTDNQYFVGQIYIELLHRQVDAEGLAYWSAMLDYGEPRVNVIQSIEATAEFRAEAVRGFYRQYLGREAGPEEVEYFVGAMNSGVTQEQVRAVFLGSGEYYQNKGNATDDGFLTALYRDVLARNLDEGGGAVFLGALQMGVSREEVSLAVLTSYECRKDLIYSWYDQFLQRPPKATSLAYWMGLLQVGRRDEEVLATIAASDEYFTGL